MRKLLNDTEAFAEPWNVKISKATILEAAAWLKPISDRQQVELLSRLEAMLDQFAKSIGHRRQRVDFNVLSRILWLPAAEDPHRPPSLLCDALALSTTEIAEFEPYLTLLSQLHTKPIRSEAVLISLLVQRDFSMRDGLSIRFAKRFLNEIRIGEVQSYGDRVARNRSAAARRGIDNKALKEEATAQFEKLAKLGIPEEDRVRIIREYMGNRVSRQTVSKWVRPLREE
jgi:hypothetical protein